MGALGDQLRQDHDDIRTIVAVLIEVASRLDAEQPVAPEDLQRLIDYADTFVRQMHHGKEETILFPALEASGVQRENGPLEVMTAEHELEFNFITGLAGAARRYLVGDKSAAPVMAEYARDYAAVLTRDMDQEDQTLIPIAEERLPQAVQDDLARKFVALETEVLGPDRHTKYHDIARDLAQRYLN